jgi:hypothetical protein
MLLSLVLTRYFSHSEYVYFRQFKRIPPSCSFDELKLRKMYVCLTDVILCLIFFQCIVLNFPNIFLDREYNRWIREQDIFGC